MIEHQNVEMFFDFLAMEERDSIMNLKIIVYMLVMFLNIETFSLKCKIIKK